MNAPQPGDNGCVLNSPATRDHQAAATSQASEHPNYRLRYQELFDFAWDAQAVTDPTGIILEANHAVAALFGCSKEFLVGKPLGLLLRRHPPPVSVSDRPGAYRPAPGIRMPDHSRWSWARNQHPRYGRAAA